MDETEKKPIGSNIHAKMKQKKYFDHFLYT